MGAAGFAKRSHIRVGYVALPDSVHLQLPGSPALLTSVLMSRSRAVPDISRAV